MDDNKDRFRYDGPSAQNAGDDLAGIASQMEDLRDFLLGLKRFVGFTKDTVDYMEAAEQQVADMLSDKWDACQEVLRAASEDELDEADTTWMGEGLPLHFQNATVESVQAMDRRLREKRTPTNPATLLSTGAL